MGSIQRIWRGQTTAEHSDAYERLLLEDVLPGIARKGIPGYLGASAGRRETAGGAEFITLLRFRSLDDVRGLTGDDFETAYVPPAAQRLLADYDPRSVHYHMILEPPPDGSPSAESPSTLASALRAVVGRGMWHGPSLELALEGVDAESAASHPVPRAHSIWELVLHVGQWAAIARERLRGGSPEVTPDMNFPPIEDAGEGAWAEAVAGTRRRYHDLADQVEGLDAAVLWREGPDGQASPSILIRGVVEHGIYHTGQIMLLRRATEAT